MKPQLSIQHLIDEAKTFCEMESKYENKELFGITDGKAVGTFIEHKFQNHLALKYEYQKGSSANGIDFPSQSLNTDVKVTSVKQPQSSCPFRNARQKIYGLGYNLLIFVYEKNDNPRRATSTLDFLNCSFIHQHRTGDFQITKSLRQMLDNEANADDIVAYLSDRNLPADEIALNTLAGEILKNPPEQGYLTISNALQWRLQYGRIVKLDESVDGIVKIINKPIS
jgi:hypothetical protein